MEQTKARQMKLTQLVKEFGVNGNELKQKDVIDLLKTVGIEKKTGGALEGEELDLFLTVLTLGNQLNNMKALFYKSLIVLSLFFVCAHFLVNLVELTNALVGADASEKRQED